MIVHNYKLMQFDHVWLSVVNNPYFQNVINFIKYKFDVKLLNNTIIVIGGDYSRVIPEYRNLYPEKTIVVYNWEQLCGGNQWLNVANLCETAKLADEIWDYDDLNSTYFNLFHQVDVAHVYPFEYYPGIETLNNKENPSIDVLFYGLLNERRARIISNIQLEMYNKFSMVVALGHSYDETLKYIENSKIVINLHAFEPYHRQEQERIGFLVSNKKCVISEPSQENYFNPAIIECPADKMTSVISNVLAGGAWKSIATSGYESFKNGKCSKRVNY